MPASYVHQSVAADACGAIFAGDAERAALLAGSEGPDPLFFSLMPAKGGPPSPKVGSILHTQRTDDFMLALADACRGSALLRAYCCGFFTHYATDTTFHPFVYAHSLTPDGRYSGNIHCTLEHQLETLHYRRQGHASGLPVQMAGFAALSPAQKDEIAAALAGAIRKTFPESALADIRVRRSFEDAVKLCGLLRSESGRKFNALGAVLSPFHLDVPLHAHMMPAEPPAADIANDAHAAWASIWKPGETRTDGFSELYADAVRRAQTLAGAALAYMHGNLTEGELRAMHGGLSYDSALPWRQSCPAKDASGVKR